MGEDNVNDSIKDELAARREAQGIFTIRIGSKESGHVEHVKLDVMETRDPLTTLKARRQRRRP